MAEFKLRGWIAGAALLLVCGAICGSQSGCKTPFQAEISDLSDPNQEVLVEVIDAEDGSPIPDAVITQGEFPGLPLRAAGKTDAHGRCVCQALPSVEDTPDISISSTNVHFWVHAAGHVSKPFDIDSGEPEQQKDSLSPLTLRMKRGRTVAGKFTREDGTPIANEPALLFGTENGTVIERQLVTNIDGGFEWSEAPDDPVYFVAGVDGRAKGAVFQKLDEAEGEASVRVPVEWETVGNETGVKLIYLPQAPKVDEFFAVRDFERRAAFLQWSSSKSAGGIAGKAKHFVTSYGGPHAPLWFVFATPDEKLWGSGQVPANGTQEKNRLHENSDHAKDLTR